MTILVPNNGEGDFLSYALNKSTPENAVLRLFKSNTTPAETDTAGTYTEADFAGYAAITLTGASWTVSEGAPTEASYAQQTFTRSSTGTAQNIYGYYTTRATSGRIAWVERFSDAPVVLTNANDKINITPKITAD